MPKSKLQKQEILRDLSEKIKKSKSIIFAGFNALTTGEEVVINAALATGKADIYWDMDRYFTDDPAQEDAERGPERGR